MKLPPPAIAALLLGLAAGTYLSPGRTAVAEHVEPAENGDEMASEMPVVPLPVSPVPAAAEPEQADTGSDIASLSAAVSGMSATDAAPMVARLSDAEAIGVLKSMPLSRASDILAAMTRERAAELSRLLLLAGAGS